ncbi:MAG: hypothetical protein H0U86_01145 [Chloroflexi bacterium]|nr:hypothetical protein [Chloroflexota bacterium]
MTTAPQERFFGERLAPAYREAGLSLDTAKQSTFEVHTLVTRQLDQGA